MTKHDDQKPSVEGNQAENGQRRQRLVRLASGAAFLALAVIAVLIVVSQGNSEGGNSDHIVGVRQIDRKVAGSPQDVLVYGESTAKVRLIEFADLQCPVCRHYSEDILPEVIKNQVRSGKVKIDFRTFAIINSQSVAAGAAAIAAGEQDRGWNYLEIFFHNQGEEGSGYVTDEFLTAIAEAADVIEMPRWNRERKSSRILNQVARTTQEAEELGFTGTPSFAIEGPGTDGVKVLGTPSSAASLESAVEEAAG